MSQMIVLTGPMGSGKTSVGKLLARRLDYAFKDLDAMLVKVTGKTINQLFAEEGEATFRDRESAQLARLKGSRKTVLSTGGGVVLREQNRSLLHALGYVVNLTATVDELTRRLACAKDRPLLSGETALDERIRQLLVERDPFYADADIRIDTTAKTLEDVVAEILDFYDGKRAGVL